MRLIPSIRKKQTDEPARTIGRIFFSVLGGRASSPALPDDEDIIYQLVDLLVDTCATKRKMLRIAGDDRPAKVVRSRFMKLNADHIKFVLKCLQRTAAQSGT